MVDVFIKCGEKIYNPAVKDGLSLSLERVGVCGKVDFEVYYDEALNIEHGNVVMLKVDGIDLFYGFVFILKEKPKTRTIKITAYDQLRYLKNKETYSYTNKTASDVIKMIANDFRLNVGDLADTKYKIASRVEDNKTLFDIILWALDETLKNTGRLYVFYDDFGKLRLKDVEHLKLDILIDDFESYDMTSSIDDETYNQIKLTKENKETGVNEVYIAKNSSNINKWGMLQYYETADDGINPKNQADVLLSLHNKLK